MRADGPLNPRADHSVLAYYQSVLALMWSLVALLGLFAATARRVQSLALFCSLEIFSTLLSACVNAVLMLLYHVQCDALVPSALQLADAEREPWLRCGNSGVGLAFSSGALFYLGFTASAALDLRFRIQKTGKRNLNWNQKPQRWKERNIRRGASAALKAAQGETGKHDELADEDRRLKYLSTRDTKYQERSLMLSFHTLEQGERRLLLLNLRKGYLKQGEWFGSKVYLSQIQQLVLSERLAGEDDDDMHQSPRSASEVGASASTSGGGSIGDLRSTSRLSGRLAAPMPLRVRMCRRLWRWLRCGCVWNGDELGDDTTLYTLTICAQKNRWTRLFGLSSTSQVSILDFGRPEERERFLGYVQALLPLNVNIERRAGGGGALGAGGGADGPLLPQRESSSACEARRPRSSSATQIEGLSLPLSLRSVPTLQPVQTEVLTLLVGTWNMGDATAPPSLEGWLPRDASDLYVVATQECPDEHWPLAVESHLGPNYVRVTERRMGGIVLLVFTHRKHASKISSVETSFTPTGVLGVGTNKGAVGLALTLRTLRLCFVNAHLAAHQEKLLQRNLHVQEIYRHLRLGVSSLDISNQFHAVWCGDLNYRIDQEREAVIQLAARRQWARLYEHDQLQSEMRHGRVFFGFQEAPLAFPPSYKYVRRSPHPSGGHLGSVKRMGTSSLLLGVPKRAQGSMMMTKRATKTDAGAHTPVKADKEGKGRESKQAAKSPAPTPERAGGAAEIDPEGAPAPADVRRQDGEVGGRAEAITGRQRRPYDGEKGRVPSYCDRVLWRSPSGPWGLSGNTAGDCEDIEVSDHAPVFTSMELEVPVLPAQPLLHHCTLYISKLALYRCRPPTLASREEGSRLSDSGVTTYSANPNLTARSAQGKGVPLSVAGAKLQNLPASLSVNVHLLPLHRLMNEPPLLSTVLSASGAATTNIVVGPMLAEREYLSTQHLHLRVTSLAGSKPTQIGQAAVALVHTVHGQSVEFDVVVEKYGCPAGYNLKGSLLLVFTKSLNPNEISPRTGGVVSARLSLPTQLAAARGGMSTPDMPPLSPIAIEKHSIDLTVAEVEAGC